MGVPGLYSWLTRNFPKIRNEVSPMRCIGVDCLYLDFNAILHPCTDKSLTDIKKVLSGLKVNLARYIDNLVEITNPKVLIYIAVDGVAPMAKIHQQRARRYESAKNDCNNKNLYIPTEDGRKDIDNGHTYKRSFDGSLITPTTSFMEDIKVWMGGFIKLRMSEDEKWKRCKVIYSSYQTPGEGEQKILYHIRNNSYLKDYSHVIYSPDADLIFLALAVPEYKVNILRIETDFQDKSNEEPELFNKDGTFSGKPIMIDIKRLREGLIDKAKYDAGGDLFDFDYFISDLLFLSFIMGNDFLPASPGFQIKSNAISKISDLYIRAFKKSKKYITNKKNSKIDKIALKAFFAECAKDENQNLREKREDIIRKRKMTRTDYSEELEFLLDTEKGKKKYYEQKMGITNAKDKKNACFLYFIGMEWTNNYYFFNNISWDFHYPLYFAPFMHDMARMDFDDFSFSPSVPVNGYEQLLLNLPSFSSAIIPEPLTEFYFVNNRVGLRNKSEVVKSYNLTNQYNMRKNKHDRFHDYYKFYDLQYLTDHYEKIYDYTAVPILPLLDYKAVHDFYESKKNLLSYDEAMRSVILKPSLFTADSADFINQEDKNQMFDLMEGKVKMSKKWFKGTIYLPPRYDAPGSIVKSEYEFVNKTMEFLFNDSFSVYGDKEKI